MKAKNVLIFGCSGQIGRSIVRKLTRENYTVTAVTRNIHQKGIVLRLLAMQDLLMLLKQIYLMNKKSENFLERRMFVLT